MLEFIHSARESDDPGLERAIRRSELLRIRFIIFLSLCLAAMAILRFIISQVYVGFVPPLIVALLVIGYESLVYRSVVRADRQDRSLPLRFWQFNAALECLIPSLGLFHFVTAGEVAPHQGLVGPPILGYALFFTLQILSLRPSIILIGACTSVAGYCTVVLTTFSVYDIPPGLPMPPGIMSFYPVFLFLIGLGAAGVCTRIRSHVVAELDHAHHRETAEAELGAASKIQRSLLPERPPTIAGFEVAGWSRPAVQTGGDYYDWQSLPDGKTGIMLADVSGHGLGPALVAAFCRAYTRASLSHHHELTEAVAQVNTLVRSDLPTAWFITFVAVILRPDSDEVELVSAGHGPILHYVKARGEVVASAADGIPLGIDVTLGITDARRIRMAAGDSLILVTDGFHEWANAGGERYGVERLCESIVRHADEAPEDMVRCVLSDVEAFSAETRQDDDLTMVVIRRR
jgi:hypothetical protein